MSADRTISPLDGRYRRRLGTLPDILSEWGLVRHRIHVEVEWLLAMAASPHLPEVRAVDSAEEKTLRSWAAEFDDDDFAAVKAVEQRTKHDVKAVEYFLRERMAGTSLADLSGFVHFACTSEDINNLAYGLMVKSAIHDVWLPAARRLSGLVTGLGQEHKARPMLSRTHGQPATPTTLGKELIVFVARWNRQLRQIDATEVLGKFNGAVGTFGAHAVAYPDAPWPDISRQFVEHLGLTWNPLTTQIEPHDNLAELFDAIGRYNTILLDFAADVWGYISHGYFTQKVVAGEVGSSTMPHKVNPINFENAEANAGMSNAVLGHLGTKLAVSRFQRDLSDSSALRNIGTGVGHSLVAISATLDGLATLEVDPAAIERDLEEAWETLGEAIQTVMRKHGYEDPYEQLKAFTRGKAVGRDGLRQFVRELNLPDHETEALLALEPRTYIGFAAALVDELPVDELPGDELLTGD